MIRFIFRRAVLFGALVLPSLATSVPASAQEVEPGPTVIFLVRHAEKGPDRDGTGDPPLTPMGRERASRLASMLTDAGVVSVLSTDYRRTLETAGPTAEQARLEVERYDPARPEAVAARLRDAPGAHLVVGHSNTTPGLVAALGGDPGEPIAESEYDRLYVVFPEGDGTARTILLRF